MAYKYASGTVNALYSSTFGDWILLDKWYKCPPASSAAMLTVAADARRAAATVYVYYNDVDLGIVEIYTF